MAIRKTLYATPSENVQGTGNPLSLFLEAHRNSRPDELVLLACVIHVVNEGNKSKIGIEFAIPVSCHDNKHNPFWRRSELDNLQGLLSGFFVKSFDDDEKKRLSALTNLSKGDEMMIGVMGVFMAEGDEGKVRLLGGVGIKEDIELFIPRLRKQILEGNRFVIKFVMDAINSSTEISRWYNGIEDSEFDIEEKEHVNYIY